MKQLKQSWLLMTMAFSVLALSACNDDAESVTQITASNTVGLSSTSSMAVEGDPAEFELVFFGLPENQNSNITVNYSVEGTGISFTGSAMIPSGEQTAAFNVVVPENDQISMDTVELTLTLTDASVGIKDDPAFNTAKFDLVDDIKTISIANDTVDISETFSLTGDTLKVPISITSALDGQVTLNYTLSGSATAGVDYELLSPNPLVIPADTAEAYIMMRVIDDLDAEAVERISLTLDGIVLANTSDTETTLATGTANRNIVYDISDDTKLLGFSVEPTDTLMISSPGEYSVELTVDSELSNELSVVLDDTGLPANVSDNNTSNIITFSPSENSRTVTFTVSESAFSTGNPDVIGSYSILTYDSNGDGEVMLSGNTIVRMKIIND